MQDVVLFTRQRGEGPQGTEQQVLDAQIRTIESYANHAHLHIIDRVVEIGISAHEMLVRVRQYLEEHPEVRAIITYSRDRLVRNFVDALVLDDLLINRKIKLYVASESKTLNGFSLDTPSENLCRTIHSIMNSIINQHYIDQLREEIRRGMAAKAEAGIWPSRAPIGYTSVVSKSGKRCLVRDKQSAQSIRRLFRKFASGHLSPKELAEWANHTGLVLNRKGPATNRSVVLRILRNSIYMGKFMWNGKTYEGTHAPIISPKLWERVQSILKRGRQ